MMFSMATLVQNKKIGLDYEILEKYEAGIELLGTEVKAVRGHHGSFEGSYVVIRGGEAFLMNSEIPPYQPNNLSSNASGKAGGSSAYDSRRSRKLLLSKKELHELAALESKKGLTVVPVSMYSKGRKLKLEIAVVRGKKKYDKRQDMKKKQTERDISREYRDR